MGFFDRNRKALAKRGIDPARLPPGQYLTERFPVLQTGGVPRYDDLAAWRLELSGLVRQPRALSFAELAAMAQEEVTVDIHCVTKWSRFDTVWRGVRLVDVLAAAGGARPEARHVLAHGEGGYSANVPLDDLVGARPALLALQHGGAPLAPEHGFPVRLLVPHLYFWKSVKWLRGLELLPADKPGYWERAGYHNYGDPFREQRYWED